MLDKPMDCAYNNFISKHKVRRIGMEYKQIYTPAKAEMVKLDTADVITTSPTFDSDIPEGEWDKEM